jgi:hypothetical protein
MRAHKLAIFLGAVAVIAAAAGMGIRTVAIFVGLIMTGIALGIGALVGARFGLRNAAMSLGGIILLIGALLMMMADDMPKDMLDPITELYFGTASAALFGIKIGSRRSSRPVVRTEVHARKAVIAMLIGAGATLGALKGAELGAVEALAEALAGALAGAFLGTLIDKGINQSPTPLVSCSTCERPVSRYSLLSRYCIHCGSKKLRPRHDKSTIDRFLSGVVLTLWNSRRAVSSFRMMVNRRKAMR